ncbi:MAG: AAA family ATPase, partial [Plesiomonas sp.]
MTNPIFVQNGSTVAPAMDRGNEINNIPVGVWTVCFHPMKGYYLDRHPDLTMPEKVYGNTQPRTDMIIKTFLDREGSNTGVLLSGNKGSGKTLLSKSVCAKILAEGMPILIMDTPFGGSDFNQFMNTITQRCVILIDEFEKKYKGDDAQNMLLSLLDGTGVNNKLYLLTSNSSQVSEFLISRPSRIFYHWNFGKMEVEVLEGYCEEHLKDKKHLENMRTLWNISTDISFDVMQAIVEELNRYPELQFLEVLCNMNISLGNALKRYFRVESIVYSDVEVKSHNHVNVNLIDFQSGEQRLRIGATCDDWNFHVAATEGLQPMEIFTYNTAMHTNVKEGKLTNEEIIKESDFDTDVNFS